MTSPLKLNFTDQEASSTVRDVLPTGDYICNLVEGSYELVKPGRKNVGKPYWKLRFVVQEGNYRGTSINTTVMLFEGALYSLAQLLKALNIQVNAGESFLLPKLESLIGKTVVVRGRKKPAETKDGQDLPERFEVQGYKSYNKANPPKIGDSALLP